MREFSILELSQAILRKWWITIVFTVAGGLVGVIFNYLHPPVYEAETKVLVNLDVIKYQLTPGEEHRILEVVSPIVNSLGVQESVVATARSSFGYSLTLGEFQQKATLERARHVLKMRIRDRDPVFAATLVNLWAEIAYQKLTQAQEHAVAAYQIQRQLDGWLACLPGYITPAPDSPAKPHYLVLTWNERCEDYAPEEIEVSILRLSQELTNQEQQSLGLAPFLAITPPETASIPDSPVLYHRGSLALAGSAVGLLLALWLIYFSDREV